MTDQDFFCAHLSKVTGDALRPDQSAQVQESRGPLPPATCNDSFRPFDQFLLHGTLAHLLYDYGAYAQRSGDGRAQNQSVLEVCDAMFGLLPVEADGAWLSVQFDGFGCECRDSARLSRFWGCTRITPLRGLLISATRK